MTEPEDDRRIWAGVSAAETLDAIDEELMALYDEACEAMTAYAALMAQRGLHPRVVLGQMLALPAAVFTDRLLPHIVMGGESGQ
jgi:hypothetical protein